MEEHREESHSQIEHVLWAEYQGKNYQVREK